MKSTQNLLFFILSAVLQVFVFVCLFVFFKSSGRNNAKYAFQKTFKNNTTQYAEKEQEEKKELARVAGI